MLSTFIQSLFAYASWATGRVLEQAGAVSPQHYVADAPVPHGSLHGTLVHMLAAQWIWRSRCQQGISPTALPGVADIPDLPSLLPRWQIEDEEMRAYVAGLTDDDLTGVIHYTTTRGVPSEQALWQILTHVLNHGTQHRSEAAMLLTSYGQSPGDLDYIIYLRRQAQ